jgi:hypothetical protein
MTREETLSFLIALLEKEEQTFILHTDGKEFNMTREESLFFLNSALESIKDQTQEEFNIDSFLAVHREIERVYRNKIDYFLFQMRG